DRQSRNPVAFHFAAGRARLTPARQTLRRSRVAGAGLIARQPSGRLIMRLWGTRLCVVGALLVMSAMAGAETVKVGVIGTFSGGYARWGEQFKQAIAVYQKQHGASVNNNAIEILYRDDTGPNPGHAKELVADLIERDKVQFITGFPWSPNALAIAQAITDAKIPTILFNAPASAITRQSPYFVRVSFTLPQLAMPLGEWAA